MPAHGKSRAAKREKAATRKSASPKRKSASPKSASRKVFQLANFSNSNIRWGNAMLAEEEGLTGAERAAMAANLKKTNNAMAATAAAKAAARTAASPARGRTMKRNRVHLPWHTPSPSPKARGASPKARGASPKAKPRKGKVMRECKSDATGCERHMKEGDCKFVHRDEPEWAMLRPEQKI
jgi:hypothetical protein